MLNQKMAQEPILVRNSDDLELKPGTELGALVVDISLSGPTTDSKVYSCFPDCIQCHCQKVGKGASNLARNLPSC